MHSPNLPQQPPALLTDLYQLTMAYGYWKTGLKDHEAVFQLFFRRAPFKGSFALACGLELAISYLQDVRFTSSDLDYVSQLSGADGHPLFEEAFVRYLENMRFSCDLDAMPEGTLAFPYEPLLRVKGPLIQAQLFETPLLSLINFQTLIATKAARICKAAEGDSVMEFGLRRAQGFNGGLGASRAAYIGGCTGTSNLLAGKLYDIPVKGTHAHSWVMAFDTEEEAFAAYVSALPNNVTLLVDTYNTLEGVQHAIKLGLIMAREGKHKLLGIRLDSGDLVSLSKEARRMLDEAGLTDTAIVASNDLDEYRIQEIKAAGGKVNVWGVGTKLVTAFDEPALGGVYKLSAIRGPGEDWQPKLKISENAEKTSDPGIIQVLRYSDQGKALADLMVLEGEMELGENMYDPQGKALSVPPGDPQALLQPIFQAGRLVYNIPSIHDTRQYALDQLASLSPAHQQLGPTQRFPVSRSAALWSLRQREVDKGLHVS